MAPDDDSDRYALDTEEVAPLTEEEVLKAFPARAATAPPPFLPLELATVFVAHEEPDFTVSTERVADGVFRARLIGNIQVGRYAEPPAIEGRELDLERSLLPAEERRRLLEGRYHAHLSFRPEPEELPKELRRPFRLDGNPCAPLAPGENRVTTIFAPDQRRVFRDPAYPWCTTGLVETPSGSGSGTMVGPRHMLTASHVIEWKGDKGARWVRFTPARFDGHAPFGSAYGTQVYFERKNHPPTLSHEDGLHDYVVVVLDRRLGDVVGWMGSRAYQSRWNGTDYWSHIGYPDDLGGRPSFQKQIALTAESDDPFEHRNIDHQGDVVTGQSGGPLFGWWDGDIGPRVTCVQSAQNDATNVASGGGHLIDLIIQARADFP